MQLRNAGLDDLMIVVTQVCLIFLPSALILTKINLTDYYFKVLAIGLNVSTCLGPSTPWFIHTQQTVPRTRS